MTLQYVEQRPAVYHSRAEVIASRRRAAGFAQLVLEAPAIAEAARPGQFVSVACGVSARRLRTFDSAEAWAAAYRRAPACVPGSPPLLRRPISIHRVGGAGRLELLFKIVGRGTQTLAELSVGRRVDVLGPMGTGFDLDGDYQSAVLIAGGAGVAPMPFLAESLHQQGKRLVVIVGVRQALPMSMRLFSRLGAELLLASETRREGFYHGVCTDLLARFLGKRRGGAAGLRAFGCGPFPMLRVVAGLCGRHGLPLQVSLEQRMGCSLGACMACVRKVFDSADGSAHPVRVCTEGPVFDAEKVKWDEAD